MCVIYHHNCLLDLRSPMKCIQTKLWASVCVYVYVSAVVLRLWAPSMVVGSLGVGLRDTEHDFLM